MNRSFRDYVDVTLDVVLQVSWNILFPLLLLSFMRISLSFFFFFFFLSLKNLSFPCRDGSAGPFRR